MDSNLGVVSAGVTQYGLGTTTGILRCLCCLGEDYGSNIM